MHRFFLFALALLIGLPAIAQRDYEEGDIVHILARSGLNIRASADLRGVKIGNVPFATAVTVVGYSEPAKAFSYEGIDGHWLKVDYAGASGYVFDGFLSRYPLFKKEYFTVNQYLEDNFEKIETSEKMIFLGPYEQSHSMDKFTLSLKGKNISLWSVAIDNDEEMTYENVLRLPGVGIEEAFTLGKALDEDYRNATLSAVVSDGVEVEVEPASESQMEVTMVTNHDDKGQIREINVSFRHEAGSCWMTVQRESAIYTDLTFGCHAD